LVVCIDISLGVLIEKVLKVTCESPQSFRSLLCCSYSAVKKFTAGRSRSVSQSGTVVLTIWLPNLLQLQCFAVHSLGQYNTIQYKNL